MAHPYRYFPIAHDEESKPVIADGVQIAKRRRTFFALLGFIFLSMGFWASKSLANGGMWKGCHSALYRLGLGTHRNLSKLTASSGKFYELPSGYKIPAVALGVFKMTIS